jgi:hypothetical protein
MNTRPADQCPDDLVVPEILLAMSPHGNPIRIRVVLLMACDPRQSLHQRFVILTDDSYRELVLQLKHRAS